MSSSRSPVGRDIEPAESEPEVTREARRSASTAVDETLLFRESALRTRWAAAHFDRPMRVVGVWAWVIWLAAFLCVCTALAWGFLGTVPTRVQGAGMLVAASGATRAISCLFDGNVRSVYVRTGDLVEKGQRIAQLEQPQLSRELEGDDIELALLRRQRQDIVRFYDRFLQQSLKASDAQRKHAQVSVDLMRTSVASNQEMVDNYRALLKRGLTTRPVLETAVDKLTAAQIQLEQGMSELEKTFVSDLNSENLRDGALRDYDARIVDLRSKREQTLALVAGGGLILSPARGRIATVDAQPDTKLRAGDLVATLADPGEPVDAVVFVSAEDAKHIQSGMQAQLMPTTVRPEEYGAIVGTIRSVGVAPESRASMLRLLNNDVVVTQLTAAGATFLVRSRLAQDRGTPSGFKWTSGNGPTPRIYGELTFGTSVTAQIVVEEQAPITIVIPSLKRWFGLHP